MMMVECLASSSRGNAYVLDPRGKAPLLLECGLSIRELKKRTGYRLHKMAGCLLTHEHQDHAKAALDILQAGVDLYTTKGTASALDLKGYRLHQVEYGKAFRIGEQWTAMAFETVHDAREPAGFLIRHGCNREKILFATDTAYIRNRFQGLTRILIECNYQPEILERNIEAGHFPAAMKARLMASHMSLPTVLDFLKANDLSELKEIWLIHSSDRNSDRAEMKAAVQRATGKPVYIAEQE